jgi:hypothetical protein
METIVNKENKTEYYLNDELLLTITDLGNNYYITENSVSKLEGYCKALNSYKTECRLDKNYTIGKNGRLYDSKKLINHNKWWFAYILEDKGFIRKAVPVQ